MAMGKNGETNQGEAREQRVKRPYEPPMVLSEAIFETTALACGKIPGQSFRCNAKPKLS
jgi:hypothetical protein